MNPFQTRSYQAAIRSYIDVEKWESPYAVTLTLRQSLQTDPGIHARLTRDTASANFRHFMNIVNKRVLGSSHTKFGKRLNVFAVLEGGDVKRLHYHAVIECPRLEFRDTFPTLIRDAWLSTNWGFIQSDIQPDSDNGWINYISKSRDKPVYDEAIDWANTSLPN